MPSTVEADDSTDSAVLGLLIDSPLPWHVSEIQRELRDPLVATDSVNRLTGCGLLHQHDASCGAPGPRSEARPSVADHPGAQRFGRNLARARHRQRVTRRQLAEVAGMRGSFISESERGMRNPRLSVLVELARALGEPVTALMEGAERPEIAPRRPLRSGRG